MIVGKDLKGLKLKEQKILCIELKHCKSYLHYSRNRPSLEPHSAGTLEHRLLGVGTSSLFSSVIKSVLLLLKKKSGRRNNYSLWVNQLSLGTLAYQHCCQGSN